jgi:peptide deformylase
VGIVDGRIVMPPLPSGNVLPVVTVPADVLSTPCVDVDPADPAVVQLAADLLATQRVSPGCVGLAANQVGVGWRVFSLDVSQHPKARIHHGEYVLVNARVESSSRGLLPGTGEEVVVETDAFEARALQHELDHLDGFVFLDRVVGPHAVFPRKTYL